MELLLEYFEAVRSAYTVAGIELPDFNFVGQWISARTEEGIIIVRMAAGLEVPKYPRYWSYSSILKVEGIGNAFNQLLVLPECDCTGSYRGELDHQVTDYGPSYDYTLKINPAVNHYQKQGLFRIHTDPANIIPLPQ